MLINHVNTNTIEAMLTIELLEVEDCWSKINAERVITSNGTSPSWSFSAISSERSTMFAKIIQSEITAIPANMLPNKYFLVKTVPHQGKQEMIKMLLYVLSS
tara:strand:- start:114069 stop:114374 length:306 start_codon:yes stop_codon:yes gene_type:complete